MRLRDAIEGDQPAHPIKSEVAGHDADVERGKRHADTGDAVGDQHAGRHGRNVLVNEGCGDDVSASEPWLPACSRGDNVGEHSAKLMSAGRRLGHGTDRPDRQSGQIPAAARPSTLP